MVWRCAELSDRNGAGWSQMAASAFSLDNYAQMFEIASS
jgi:hypothetical protein